jgi:hypothetical protein
LETLPTKQPPSQCLPRHAEVLADIAENGRRRSHPESIVRRDRAGASYGQEAVPHEMKPNYPRSLGLVFEVAQHCIPELFLKDL